VLRGIWLCREIDLDWWFGPVRLIYPEYWQAFVDFIPQAERQDLLGAYLRRLLDPDPAVHMPAAITWDRYETSCATLLPPVHEPLRANMLSMPRLEAHYMQHRCFLRDNELIDAVPRFRHVPGVIVHGRYDMLCPTQGALLLAKAWPEAALHIVPDAGHAATEPGIRRQLVAATDRFRDLKD
jgi:proline iminopeptidase